MFVFLEPVHRRLVVVHCTYERDVIAQSKHQGILQKNFRSMKTMTVRTVSHKFPGPVVQGDDVPTSESHWLQIVTIVLVLLLLFLLLLLLILMHNYCSASTATAAAAAATAAVLTPEASTRVRLCQLAPVIGAVVLHGAIEAHHRVAQDAVGLQALCSMI